MLNKLLVNTVGRATDMQCAVLLANIAVRGYSNNLLGRAVYEYKTKDESKPFMSKTQACSAVYLEGDLVYPDLPHYKSAYLTKPDGSVTLYQTLDIGRTDEGLFLSDYNWDHGIARHWSGFFVPNTAVLREQLSIGSELILANGEVRKIVKSELYGGYINIYLDGPAMRFQDAGKPDSFVVRRSLAAAAG